MRCSFVFSTGSLDIEKPVRCWWNESGIGCLHVGQFCICFLKGCKGKVFRRRMALGTKPEELTRKMSIPDEVWHTKIMARSAGIEPTTPAFGGQYSIHWATSAQNNVSSNQPVLTRTVQAVFYLNWLVVTQFLNRIVKLNRLQIRLFFVRGGFFAK